MDSSISSGEGGSRRLLRSVAVWLAMIVAESLNGTLREMFLVPTLGDTRARQLSFGIAVILIWTIIYSSIRWVGPANVSQALVIGVLLTVLMLGFEFAIGRLVFQVSWDRIAEDYDPRRGGLMLFGMMFLATAPALAYWLRPTDGQAR